MIQQLLDFLFKAVYAKISFAAKYIVANFNRI